MEKRDHPDQPVGEPASGSEVLILRDFFDNAPDMFGSVDAETGRIRDCNNTLLRNLGRARETVVGSPVASIYHPDCHGEVERVFHDFRNYGEAMSEGLALLKADGSKLKVSLRVTAVRDEGGRILYSRSIWRDSSLVREVASLRLDARLQKAYHLESLAVLAGGVAHDFNNLLVGILGNAGLALAKLPPESPARETIEEIEQSALRAAELTNQMLAYSGSRRFEHGTVDLTSLVEEMVHLLEVALSKRVVLQLDLARPGPLIEAGATQVRQIVMNLITNGSDAIGERSGIVTIRTGSSEVGQPELDAMTYQGTARPGYFGFVEVSDTGYGMDPDVKRRMFDPFFTTKEEGHGLGLAAMLGIVQGHEGAVRVDSELGKGTTVRVVFPLSSAPVETAEPEQVVEHRGGLVLVVDDEEPVRTVTKRILEARGYEVLTCSNGEEGLETYRERFDELCMVLLDMTMPRMDGFQALQGMRRIHEEMAFLLMSGYHEQDIDEQRREGVHFIQKPFMPDQLLAAVAGCLATPSA